MLREARLKIPALNININFVFCFKACDCLNKPCTIIHQLKSNN